MRMPHRFGHRSRATVVAAAVAVSLTSIPLAASSPGTARASTDELADVTVTEVEVDVTVGPDRETTCRVVADLYLPSTATPGTPQPAVLTTHGFGGSKESQAGIARALAERHYVVLAYSGLGFGGTDCKIYLDAREWDGRAAQQLVDYLAGEKKDVAGGTVDVVALDGPGDPKVGMFGGSYGGQVQFAAAAVDPRIDAIVPAVTWNDLAYALAPNNTGDADDVGVFKRIWTDLFAIQGVISGLEYAVGDPRRLLGCPNFDDWICPALIESNLDGFASAATVERMREVSVASYVEDVRAPTLLLQGQDDTLFNLQEAIRTYEALKAQGTPVRMIWHRWGHSGSDPAPGELDLGGERAPETTYLGRRVLDWFAHWLRDDDSAPLGPELAYFRDWVEYDGSLPEGAEPAYGTSDAYPVGSVREFYLSGDGALTDDRTKVTPGSRSWLNLPGVPTSYSEFPPEFDALPPSDLDGTYRAWTSEPFDAPVTTVGVPTLDVRFESPVASLSELTGPAGRLIVFAKLYDVAPDGSIELVHRLVSPVRVPDVDRPWRIELPGIVHRFEQGHRLQVVLAASDLAYASNVALLPVTVRTTASSVPTLRLPVVD